MNINVQGLEVFLLALEHLHGLQCNSKWYLQSNYKKQRSDMGVLLYPC